MEEKKNRVMVYALVSMELAYDKQVELDNALIDFSDDPVGRHLTGKIEILRWTKNGK